MKGFLYLVEISVAAILVAVILGSFFAVQAGTADWTRADLVGAGNNIFDTLGDDIKLVLNTKSIYDTIDTMKPANVKYTLRIRGIPKEDIHIGSNNPGSVSPYLNDGYLNERVIDFTVTGFGDGDPLDGFDVIVLYDYPDYSDPRLADYSETKAVIAIEPDTNDDMKTFFDLGNGDGTTTNLGFSEYDDIVKYFHGIGFIINTPFTHSDTNRYGNWEIKDTNPYVKISGDEVCVSSDINCVPSKSERQIVPWDGENYLVKKIDFPDNKVYFSIKDTGFTFENDFSNGNLRANDINNDIVGDGTYSAAVRNGNRVWIARPTNSNTEYRTLIQSAVASSAMDWYMDEPDADITVEVSRFVSLCCDIPEVAEISFVLWYVF